MSRRIRLKDQDGADLVAQQGESLNLIGSFSDLSSTPATLEKANLATVTLTLFAGTSIINSRDEVDIKDSVDADGDLTLKLDPADQAIVDGSIAAGGHEEHVARIDWTWNDGTTRTGRVEYLFEVEKLASPT